MSEITGIAIVNILSRQPGKENALTAMQLSEMIRGIARPNDDRVVRKSVIELRREGFPICSSAQVGYWWARNTQELADTQKFIRGRAMHSLKVESNLQKRAMPALAGQGLLPVGAEPVADRPRLATLVAEIPEDIFKLLKSAIAKRKLPIDGVIERAVELWLEVNGLYGGKE